MKNRHQVKPKKEITQPQLFHVNAFVARGCSGNPAGVCLLPEKKDEELYKKVAVRMNMSETAFVFREDVIYQLRWFTRNGSEVDLCGHATLAVSYILWQKGYMDTAKPLHFKTRSGILSAVKEGNDITLDFPRDRVNEFRDEKQDLAVSLGVTPLYVGKTKFDYLAVLDSESAVKSLVPDIKKLKGLGERGVIVTAKATGKKYDFVSRFFAPAVGIDEDPVTGSAHCALGPYWGAILKKNELTGYQVSRKGGMVKVKVLKDRVLVGGRAKEVKLPVALLRSLNL
jgi:PhzF family phenazine biosynthesis protein